MTAATLTSEVLAVARQAELAPPATLPDAALLHEVLAGFALGATILNTYLARVRLHFASSAPPDTGTRREKR